MPFQLEPRMAPYLAICGCQMQMAAKEDKDEVSDPLFWPFPSRKMPQTHSECTRGSSCIFAALGYQSRLWNHEEVPCALLDKTSVAELY